MICPNCHNEIPEGLLLCEKCGAEINLVPDFDIEIENNINETLSTIVDETFSEKTIETSSNTSNSEEKEKKNKQKTKEELLEEEFFRDRIHKSVVFENKKKGLILILAALAVIVVVAVFVSLFVYKNFSVAYQIKQAEDSMYNGRYEEALNYVHRASELSPEDMSVALLESNILRGMGDTDSAKFILLNKLEHHKMEYYTKSQYYLSLIELYIADDDYEVINKLLLDSNDSAIMDEYNDYIALAPEFSIPMGNYSESQSLSLTANTEGKIYYTLDGSKPSALNGYPYQNPIKLISGEYDVKAVFISKYGVESEVANSFYIMDVPAPSAPLVEPQSGNFDHTITVTVTYDEGDTLYYTTDGKDPNPETALVYDSPIDVPFGLFNYCFMSVNEDGVSSDVVKRSYNLTPNANITVKMANLNIYNVLKSHDLILDLNGTAPQNAGTYSYNYNTIIEISGGRYYYKFDEFLTNASGIKNATGLLYAVDIETNQVNRLLINSSGNWELIPLN